MNLFEAMLGPGPYVLIRFGIDEDGDLVADLEAGGGCQDVRAALLLVLAELEPLTAKEVETLTAPRDLPCGCSA